MIQTFTTQHKYIAICLLICIDSVDTAVSTHFDLVSINIKDKGIKRNQYVFDTYV